MMERMDRQPSAILRRALLQAMMLVVAALLLAVVINEVRHDRLPWMGSWSPERPLHTEEGEALAISLEDARELYLSGSCVMLDARSPALYFEGHIQGAINLPWEAYDEMAGRVLSAIPKDATIIAYCDGQACGLSKELAIALMAEGYRHVRILVNGWSVWLENGLPVAMGTGDPWG